MSTTEARAGLTDADANAPAPPETATSAWRMESLKALGVVEHSWQRLLAEAPPDTSLDDLLAARAVLAPLPSLREQIAAWALAVESENLVGHRNPATQVVDGFASDHAGQGPKAAQTDRMLDWLRDIDRTLAQVLRDNGTTPEAINTFDFDTNQGGIRLLLEPSVTERTLVVGLLDTLPPGHLARALVGDSAYPHPSDGRPCLVLGRANPGAQPGGGTWHVKPYYVTQVALMWHSKCLKAVDDRLLAKPPWTLSAPDIERLRLREQKRDNPPVRVDENRMAGAAVKPLACGPLLRRAPGSPPPCGEHARGQPGHPAGQPGYGEREEELRPRAGNPGHADVLRQAPLPLLHQGTDARGTHQHEPGHHGGSQGGEASRQVRSVTHD
jgi:hypothetical protein